MLRYRHRHIEQRLLAPLRGHDDVAVVDRVAFGWDILRYSVDG